MPLMIDHETLCQKATAHKEHLHTLDASTCEELEQGIRSLTANLILLCNTLDTCHTCQERKWSLLYSLKLRSWYGHRHPVSSAVWSTIEISFRSEDARQRAPNEFRKFQAVDQTMR